MPTLANARHEAFAIHLAKGKTQTAAAIAAGYSRKTAAVQGSTLLRNPKITGRVSELQQRVAEKTTWDSAKIIERLGEIADAKGCDFDKPRSEWTDAMERLACDVEDMFERSSDGVQAGDSKSWDKVGARIRIPMSVKVKALELLAKCKGVDALVNPRQEIDVNVNINDEINKRIAAGRQRASERNAKHRENTTIRN